MLVTRHSEGTPKSMMRRAGRVPIHELESLENRVLLGGDHPSFTIPLDFDSGDEITLDNNGIGSLTGTIDPAGDDDLFRFTAPSTDFVSVWADTVNTAAPSSLDSRVEVYDIDGMLVAQGSANGVLTGGSFEDGHASFIAQAGETYFVRVMSDELVGNGATGDYVARIDALTTALTLAGNGTTQASGTINLAGNDQVFRFTTGSAQAFDSLISATGQSATTGLDTRIEIYDAQGNLITGDSQSGRLTNPFDIWQGGTEQTFYLRVRGDEFLPANANSTGAYAVAIATQATPVSLDPISRVGNAGASAGNNTTFLYSFQAQGSGLTIVEATGTGLSPLTDAALTLYDDDGNKVAFSDDGAGTSPIIFKDLDGGETYFLVVDGFNVGAVGTFTVWIESNHTQGTPDFEVDDHANTPDFDENNEEEKAAARPAFENATPLVLGDLSTLTGAGYGSLVVPALDGVTGTMLADHSGILIAQDTGRGTTGDTDLFMITPPVNMLGSFAGKEDPDADPAIWQPNHRPATRLHIMALYDILGNGSQAPFANTQIRVFDSNLDIVYDTNDEIFNPGFNFTGDPSGMIDPASYPPELTIPDHGFELTDDDVVGIEVWGGETYFIEVTVPAGGQYNLFAFTDALPLEDGTGDHIDNATGTNLHSTHQETADAGEWAFATKIPVSQNTGDGNSTLFGGGTISLGVPGSIDAAHERAWAIGGANVNAGFLNDPVNTANGGIAILQETGLPVIESIDDTDLFFFTAVADGTVEIRLGTTNLPTGFSEIIIDGEDDPMDPSITQNSLTKTISSLLDARLRIFNNDLVQISTNDDNPALAGRSELDFPIDGPTDPFEFRDRDPRVVFEVKAGEKYFIQVESAQLGAWQAAMASGDFSGIDWRSTTGIYDIFINGTEDQPDDDHHDAVFNRSTVIPIGLDGQGSVTGEIVDPQGITVDVDSFEFVTVGKGLVSITASADNGSQMTPTIAVFDVNGDLINSSQGAQGGSLTMELSASHGERYFVRISSPTDGAYTLSIDSPAFADDHAGIRTPQFSQATELEVLDFLGEANGSGVIENAGDMDLFSFDATGYDLATVTVTATDPNFEPFVEVFEVGEDFVGNPVMRRIAFAFDNTGDGDANISFPVSASRTSMFTGLSHNTYFVLVSGRDADMDAGDYDLRVNLDVTDDHPDIGQFSFASTVTVVAATGDGEAQGVIEQTGDTDLFRFIAPAGGTASVQVQTPGSSLNPFVQIIQVDGQGNETVIASQTDSDSGANGTVSVVFNVVRSAEYFVLVGGDAALTPTGAFDVSIDTPTVDDHANETEFVLATTVNVVKATGDGIDTGEIETVGDTDLFTFKALDAGQVVLEFNAGEFSIVPVVSLFDSTQAFLFSAIDGGFGDADGQRDGRLRIVFDASMADESFFALLSASPDADADDGEFLVGAYAVSVDGPPAPQDPNNPDDHANAGDFENATPVALSFLTGDADATGVINETDDTDLFTFASLADGRAFVQVVTEPGLNVRVRIFGPDFELIATDAVGVPGASASVNFQIDDASKQYYVEVSSESGTGDYTVRLDAEPQTHFLYFPEGFANGKIDEFVSVFNPNDTSITYSIILRYEDPSLPVEETVVVNQQVLGAGMRDGATISQGSQNFLAEGVIKGTPYAIIVTSDAPIGASLSHYDFDVATGESFTDTTSSSWSFARAERVPGAVKDFLVFYNPNDHAAVVSLTAYTANGPVTLTQTVGANRRSGWDLNAQDSLPTGIFGIVVSSEAANPNDAGDHIGIVASLTHFNVTTGEGFSALGDPDLGAVEGVVPSLTEGEDADAELVLFNPGDTSAIVTIVGEYRTPGFSDLTQIVELGAHETLRISGAQLGLIAEQTAGIRYTSTAPVSVQASETRSGDGNSTGAITHAAQSFFFGDGFINAKQAGVKYTETIDLFNPADTSIEVTLTFSFSTGAQAEATVTVDAGSFAQVNLHELSQILEQGKLNFFGIEASAESPFAASMTHYDLFLRGGWTAMGAPLGLTTSLDQIT